MADVAQAAKWIDEGFVVKRSAWLYEGRWDGLRKARTSTGLLGRTGLNLEDLLAEDWEIAEG
jgi:hypothetical protein